MSYILYPDGADPDPWTIYPISSINCGQCSPLDSSKEEWVCTRGAHQDSFHVARQSKTPTDPCGKLCATWDSSEDMEKKHEDATVDRDGTVHEFVEKKKPEASKKAAIEKWTPPDYKKGDKVILVSAEEFQKRAPGASTAAYGRVKKGEVLTLIADGLCGDMEDCIYVQNSGGQTWKYKVAAFDLVTEVEEEKSQEVPEVTKENKMAKKTDKTEVEKAEIVYSERVTFRVDEGKEVVIDKEDEAIKWLQNRKEEREKEISFTENIDGSYPSDGMIALARVLRREFGFMRFDSPTPWGVPHVFNIPTDARGGMQDAPWGKFSIPGLNGFLQTSIAMDKKNQPIFQLAAKIKNKDKDKVKHLAKLVREDLKSSSIYRGKAIRVEFPDFRHAPFDPAIHVPTFLDVSTARPDQLIFNKEVQNAIQLSLFTPIQHSEATRKFVGKLKRGILLAGQPGTGKTLAANVTAKLCEDNGWTFIYLASTGDFAQAVGFAKMYQPSVIFAEDLDSIVCNDVEDNDRDESTTAVLNTLDGVDSKDSEIMVVFTTNYPEKINKAMLRPGRLDAVITITPPDSIAVEKLIRIYGRGLVPENEVLTPVAESLAGQIPAVIREVVERAKLAAIPHTLGGNLIVSAVDLGMARDSMLSHLRMLNEKRLPPPSDIEKAANVVMTHVMEAMKKASEGGGDNWDGEQGMLVNPPDKDAKTVRVVQASLPMPGRS